MKLMTNKRARASSRLTRNADAWCPRCDSYESVRPDSFHVYHLCGGGYLPYKKVTQEKTPWLMQQVYRVHRLPKALLTFRRTSNAQHKRAKEAAIKQHTDWAAMFVVPMKKAKGDP